jgi:hypothetical protein
MLCWVVTQYSSERAGLSEGHDASIIRVKEYAGFLLTLLFGPEDGNHMFL